MKICFFTENNYPGGMDKYIYTLINNWNGKEDVITLYCNKGHPGFDNLASKVKAPHQVLPIEIITPTWEFINSIRAKRIMPEFFLKIISFLLKYSQFPIYVIKLKRFFDKSNFKQLLIINGGYPGGNCCRAASIAWYLSKSKSSPMACLSTLKRPAWYAAPFEYVIDKILKKTISKFIFVSKFVQSTLPERPQFLKNKATIIYPAISTLDSEGSKSTPNTKNHTKTVTNFLMLGTYEEHKGHDLLFDSIVKALNVSDKIHFNIAGHGTSIEKEHIVKGINSRKLSKHVRLMGFQPDPYSLYRDCDVVVIPSIAYDSISLVAVEAMSLRKPIITTNIGGLEELFNLNPNIGLMSKINPDHFSQCLIKIIENHEIRTTMGNNGYNLFRKYFTAEIFAQSYYKNVIE